MKAEQEKWDRRYAKPGYRMGAGPKLFLKQQSHHLPPSGVVADLACGEGQTGVFLAEQGYRVTGYDISAVGLNKAERLAEQAEVSVEWKVADLDDLHLGEACWDGITCIHYLNRDLFPRIRNALKPGGVAIFEILVEELNRGGEPKRYHMQPNELLRTFVDWHIRVYCEGVIHGRSVAQLVAMKPEAR